MNKITVDKALIIKKIVEILVMVVLSLALIISFLQFLPSKVFIFIITSLFIIAGAILNVKLSKILIFWAFSRVENVHELKKRLIIIGDVTEKSEIFKKIENSAQHDTKYWKIRLKFAAKDIFVDDNTIPEETVLFYSKIIYISVMLSCIFIFALGTLSIVFAIYEKIILASLLGFFLILYAIFLGYRQVYKKLKYRDPQLIINNKGIKSKKSGFHKWEEIKDYKLGAGRLIYTHSGGNEHIEIFFLNIRNNGIKLSKILMICHERNKLQYSKINEISTTQPCQR